jgi:23S rRNA (pseudouridine1915-N3)-methyltransferase
MIKIKLLTVYKTKERWLKEALDEYEKRLSPFCKLEWILAKNELQLEALSLEEPFVIALDPHGQSFNSIEFSHWLLKKFQESKSRLSFVIGGPEGLSNLLKNKAHALWSLSPLTFTGQMTRLLLLEQLYRAFEISKGSRYHK